MKGCYILDEELEVWIFEPAAKRLYHAGAEKDGVPENGYHGVETLDGALKILENDDYGWVTTGVLPLGFELLKPKEKDPYWIGKLAKKGDKVRVRNLNGRAWRNFVCKERIGKDNEPYLYLDPVTKDDFTRLVGGTVPGVSTISYNYIGVKQVVEEFTAPESEEE
jgi:hypothetical protein